MIHYSKKAIGAMTGSYRANFINSLSGFKSSNLIGSVDKLGYPNVAIFSSVVHLGANPALIGMVSRPRSVERHSIENLMETGAYTINHVNQLMLRAAHQSSARYPRGTSEFDATGLTTEYIEGFSAPCVAESRLSILMKFVESKHLEINNTEFIIGEIQHVVMRHAAVQEDGYIDIEALGTIAASGLDGYHSTERIGRLSYAKPNKDPEWIYV